MREEYQKLDSRPTPIAWFDVVTPTGTNKQAERLGVIHSHHDHKILWFSEKSRKPQDVVMDLAKSLNSGIWEFRIFSGQIPENKRRGRRSVRKIRDLKELYVKSVIYRT